MLLCWNYGPYAACTTFDAGPHASHTEGLVNVVVLGNGMLQLVDLRCAKLRVVTSVPQFYWLPL